MAIKLLAYFVSLGALITLVGCAGTVPPAHIYSPAEKQMLRNSLGTPSAQLNATGEARYCTGMAFASQNASQKQQALASIAAACGGEDNYFVIDELPADVRFSAMGAVETSCTHGAGRAIYFKCKRAGSQPSAVTNEK